MTENVIPAPRDPSTESGLIGLAPEAGATVALASIEEDHSNAPTAVPAAITVPDRQTIVCPECGTVGEVALNRRDAVDFCSSCDFPLFWTPSAVMRDDGIGGGDSLRRLPGTGGRQTVASADCPTCGEPNSLTAAICIRCNNPMVLVIAEPETVAIVIPEIEPEPEPEPEGIAWWWWAIAAATLVALIALIVVAVAQ